MKTHRHRNLAGVLLCLSLAGVEPQAQTAVRYVVASVEATGIKRFTVADVVKVSGLTVGQSVAAADLDAAAAAMVATGLFKGVRYQVTTKDGKIAVTFTVDEETDWSVPVMFDNFIWMSDEDVLAAVRDVVPAFDGKAPAKSQVLDTIGTGLARLLKSRGIPGQIDYQPSIKLGSGGSRGHVFSVVSPSPRLCSLNFEGASVVSEADLRTAASDAIGQPYSKSFMADFANKTLVQPYQKRGHWKAAFAPPVVKAGAAGDCAGAIVSIKVDEGAGYRWSRTLWEGNTAVQANRLDKLLVVTPDAIADGTIVPAGLRAIEDEYRRFGYMQQTSNQGLVFDDEAKRVALRITIREGAVFRMGNFVADGLPQNIEDALRKKWKLKSGEVFDASYFTDFLRKELAPYSTPARPLVLQYRINSSAQTVDVVVAPKK